MIILLKKILKFLLPIICLGFIWQLYSLFITKNISLLPTPITVFSTLWILITDVNIFFDISVSMYRLMAGIILGSIFGILLGLATGYNKGISNFFSPILLTFRQFPSVAIVPFMIVWFGIDDLSKVFSTAFATFFPVWLGAHTGVRNIPDIYLKNARQFTSDKIKIFSKVIFPGSLSFIISGIRTSIAVAFTMIFVSELAGASRGLGYQMSIAQLSYRMDKMIAILFIFGVLGVSTDYLFLKLTQIFFPWIKYTNK